MRIPARTGPCSTCGSATGRRYIQGLCPLCYSRQPRPRARNRWRLMIYRCTDPNNPAWPLYGARGIKVCQRWLDSFDAYYQDVGDAPPRMSLDRIDNDGDYEPGNVRWADQRTQSLNQRNHQAAKTHCPHGHPYDHRNTHHTPTGKRACRACGCEKQRRYLARLADKGNR